MGDVGRGLSGDVIGGERAAGLASRWQVFGRADVLAGRR